MKNTILFHCAEALTDESGTIIVKPNGKIAKDAPTHTLAFRRQANTLIMGWAVAHSEHDIYSRKVGRSIAEGRLNTIDVSTESLVVDAITGDLLPQVVLEHNLSFYVNKATELLFDENEIGKIALCFHSVNKELCFIHIDAEIVELVDEDLETVKRWPDDNATADYIFSTYTSEDNEVIVHVQNKQDFISGGYNESINDDMIKVLGAMVGRAGFMAIDDFKAILVHPDKEEIEVVLYLKSQGLAYSVELDDIVTK